MSWLKKLFTSPSSSQSSSQSASQEPKVYYSTQKSETEEPKRESDFEQCD